MVRWFLSPEVARKVICKFDLFDSLCELIFIASCEQARTFAELLRLLLPISVNEYVAYILRCSGTGVAKHYGFHSLRQISITNITLWESAKMERNDIQDENVGVSVCELMFDGSSITWLNGKISTMYAIVSRATIVDKIKN